jgi:predicted XRE-type DNA-binding protein
MMGENWGNDPRERTAPVVGSGNFLADRGYRDPEEARAKFQLANQIALLVEDHNLRQADVCAMTGLKQPDVSKILNGNVSGFSVWRLLQVLKGLGERVTISVEAPDAEDSRALFMAL